MEFRKVSEVPCSSGGTVSKYTAECMEQLSTLEWDEIAIVIAASVDNIVKANIKSKINDEAYKAEYGEGK